ncbi:hypothetical protein CARUB_v10005041mg [Capsella rubella]|uniref:F-box domain-containing protein n=1 Tax=Capsella rubella TaxID=81985 RepID=R0GWX3_9BRAS|nr:F-box/kelch-repeat protein At4g14905 [Capsella rubella]XP_023634426.1 F-box/kelch-repeat protein At4g14905 [Capsella rubella]EOA16820.1 hypothetical protein CARUB_v10005041mg [Capsella rubella]
MSHSAASSDGSFVGESSGKKPIESASSSSYSSSLEPLYDEIAVNCFARVPRCYYPAISLVSRNFRRLIASPDIYIERSVIRRTENVLYVAIRSQDTKALSWYTLNLKPFGTTELSHRLVPVPSFPSIPSSGASIISAGSEIYVIGGCINGEPISIVSVIDCRSHTSTFLPNMKEPRNCAAVGFIDGKLYVVGGCNTQSINRVEAFNFKTRTWESLPSLCDEDIDLHGKTSSSVVMNGMIYGYGDRSSFVYDPEEGRIGRDLLLVSSWMMKGRCVIDNMFYAFFRLRDNMVVYDLSVRKWGLLLGLQDLREVYEGCTMVNLGGRLAILFVDLTKCPAEIWCTEIALERAEEGFVNGRLLWSNHVLTLTGPFIIEQALSVTV